MLRRSFSTSLLITREQLKKTVSTLYHKIPKDRRLLTLNQVLHRAATNMCLSAFTNMSSNAEYYCETNEILSALLMAHSGDSVALGVYGAELDWKLPHLLHCPVVCLTTDQNLYLMVSEFDGEVEVELDPYTGPYRTEMNGMRLYSIDITWGLYMTYEAWCKFIQQVTDALRECNDTTIYAKVIAEVWDGQLERVTFDEVYLTDSGGAYVKLDKIPTNDESAFRQLVVEQALYSPPGAVYELLDSYREDQ